MKKTLLWLLAIYVLSNHAIRYLAIGAAAGPEQSFATFAKSISPATI